MTATERTLNDTMAHVKALKQADSYRVLGRRFNVPFATLRDIACGRFDHVSWDTLLLVRMRLGLPDLPPLYEIEGCPSCGSVHVAGDCHGEPFESIIFLHRSALFHVKHAAPRQRTRYLRPCLSLDPHTRRAQLLRLLQDIDGLEPEGD